MIRDLTKRHMKLAEEGSDLDAGPASAGSESEPGVSPEAAPARGPNNRRIQAKKRKQGGRGANLKRKKVNSGSSEEAEALEDVNGSGEGTGDNSASLEAVPAA